jgi:hypothetical protein
LRAHESREKALDVSITLIKRIRALAGEIKVKNGGQGGLISGRRIAPTRWHLARQPFFCAPDALRIGWRLQGCREISQSLQGFGSGEEPGFELSFGQDYGEQ